MVELGQLTEQRQLQARPLDHEHILKSQNPQTSRLQVYPQLLLISAPFNLMCDPEPFELRSVIRNSGHQAT